MQLIHFIKSWFFSRAIAKLLETSNGRTSNFNPYNPGKRILLLYDCTDPQNRQVIQKFTEELRDHGKAVVVICYYDEKKVEAQSIPHRVISRSDVNLFEIPKADALQPLEDKQFDILINFDRKGTPPLTYITAWMDCALKVGFTFSDYPEVYDLLIDQEASANLGKLIADLRKIINTLSGSPEPLGFL